MPNRILRNWTDSESVNNLTVHAERFFTRLIMTVDDYGRYMADPRLLKASLFPLLLDQVREADITRWAAECEKAGLIVLYQVSSKSYIQVENFNQRLRVKKEKYPPPSNDGHVSGKRPLEEEEKPKKNPNLETEVEVESLPPPKNLIENNHGEFLEQLFAAENLEILNQMAMGRSPRKPITREETQAFNGHLIVEGKNHRDFLEWRKHFRNWLNTKPKLGFVNNQNPKGKVENNLEIGKNLIDKYNNHP